MGFKIQGAGGILEKLTQTVATSTERITDFNVGSATRTLLESVSLQMEEFYYDLKKAVEYAIKNACYHAFGFKRYNATKATGTVTISFTSSLKRDKVFEKGTKFHTANNTVERVYFESTETIIAKAGTGFIDIPVICTREGSIGNVNIGDISRLVVGSPGIESIMNERDFIDGKDMETLTDRSVRFTEFIKSLQRGTVDAISYGIKQVPGVAGVSIDDTYYGIVYAYVHDRNGDLSKELEEQVLKAVTDYRSGGIEVAVRPMVKIYADLDIDIIYKAGIDGRIYDGIMLQAVKDYLNSLKAAESLHLSNLITSINDTYRDIISYVNIKDNKDIHVLNNEIIRAGKIKIN